MALLFIVNIVNSPDGKVKDLNSDQPDGIWKLHVHIQNGKLNQKKPARIHCSIVR